MCFTLIATRVVTPKSETLTTVSTMDACVSTEDEDFNDIEDDEEDDVDDEEPDKEVSWRDRCLHFGFFARISRKFFIIWQIEKSFYRELVTHARPTPLIFKNTFSFF